MKSSRVIRSAGLIGIAASLFGLCSVLVATFLAGDTFSWSRNALSDIGVSTVSLAANVFNISFIITGVLNFIFAIGFTKANSKNTLFYFGGLLLILGGISLSLVGVFTEASGRLHFYVSVAYFSLVSLGILAYGLAYQKAGQASKAYASVLTGLIAGLVVLSGTAAERHVWLGLGFAVPELISSVMFGAWTAWMGYNLFAANNQPM